MLKQTDAWGAIFTPTVVAHQVLASALPLLLAIGFRNTAAAGLTSHAFGSLVVGLGCAILGLHALVLYGYLALLGRLSAVVAMEGILALALAILIGWYGLWCFALYANRTGRLDDLYSLVALLMFLIPVMTLIAGIVAWRRLTPRRVTYAAH